MTATDFNFQFNRLSSHMENFAYILTRNVEDAKDLYQETAHRAFKNMDKYQPNTNLKAWLMTMMKNIFINDYRRKAKRNVLLDGTKDQYHINAGDKTVQNEAEGSILMRELKGMIEELPEDLKIPFVMHYEGYKYQEIADEFNLPLGTVKSRIFFARKELKGKIKSRYQNREVLSA